MAGQLIVISSSLFCTKHCLATTSLLLVCMVMSVRVGWSDEKATTVRVTAKNPAKAEKAAANKAHAATTKISPEREAAAIEFAKQNHPELAGLLPGLKQNAPKEYQAALLDLDRTVERLAKSKDKSPERHQFELAEWKLTSRIRLLAARLTMSDDPVVEAELRAALRERLELRLDSQRSERDRMQKRVDRLDQQIDEMSSKADAILEKQFADLRKTSPAPKPAAKNKVKRPALPDQVDVKGDKP
jgi:hypothetical protein